MQAEAVREQKEAVAARLVAELEMREMLAAGLDEGLLSLRLSNLLYVENFYSYKKCQ